MLNETWKKLQNGSDIRGVALEGIEGQSVNLTPEIVQQIACSFAAWLAAKTDRLLSELTVAVGNDSRLSAEALSSAVTQGLSMLGVTVVNCGLCSTPAMFMTTVMEGYKYDGSIMLTASHLPYNRNGLKFFTKDGGLEKGDITEILELSQEKIYTRAGRPGEIRTLDFIQVYAADIVRKIRSKTGEERPLEGFRIIVDAGNGAGGFYADQVLKPPVRKEASFWSRTAVSRTISRIRRIKRQWPLSGKRFWNRTQISGSYSIRMSTGQAPWIGPAGRSTVTELSR